MTGGLQPAIVAAAFLASTAVGTGVTAADLRAVASRPFAVLAGTLAQWLLLPAIALGLVAVARPPAAVAIALVLAAACPGAALSNTYVFLAGADVALSFVLTAISTAAAVLTLPPLLALGLAAVGAAGAPAVELWPRMLTALTAAVLLPVLLGMALRHAWPADVARRQAALRRLAGVAVVTVVAMIVADQWSPVGRYAASATLLGLALAVLGGVAGHATAAAAGLPREGRFALMIELACRNMAVHVLVAGEVLDNPDVLAVGVVLFLAQVVACLAAVAVRRRLS